ncbi:MAG: hypothetical protein V2B19_28440 [Pseudomonadota bacterium]
MATYTEGTYKAFLVSSKNCEYLFWMENMKVIDWQGIDKGLENPRLANLPLVKVEIHWPFSSPIIEKDPAPVKTNPPASAKKVYVQTESGDKHPWHDELPPAWRAPRPEDADLIVTLRVVPQLGKNCGYGYGVDHQFQVAAESKTVICVNVIAHLSLQDKRKVVAERTFEGPNECPAKWGIGTSEWIPGAPRHLNYLSSG